MFTLLEFLLRFLFNFFVRFPLLVTQIFLENLSRTSGGGGFSIKMLPQPHFSKFVQECVITAHRSVNFKSNPPTPRPPPIPLRHLLSSKTKVTRDTDSDGHTVVNAPEILLSALPPSLSEPAMHILTFFLLQNTKYTHL